MTHYDFQRKSITSKLGGTLKMKLDNNSTQFGMDVTFTLIKNHKESHYPDCPAVSRAYFV